MFFSVDHNGSDWMVSLGWRVVGVRSTREAAHAYAKELNDAGYNYAVPDGTGWYKPAKHLTPPLFSEP